MYIDCLLLLVFLCLAAVSIHRSPGSLRTLGFALELSLYVFFFAFFVLVGSQHLAVFVLIFDEVFPQQLLRTAGWITLLAGTIAIPFHARMLRNPELFPANQKIPSRFREGSLVWGLLRLRAKTWLYSAKPRGGRRIGRYEIISELGRGGMGTVYKALTPDGKVVAVKLIGGAQGEPAGLEEPVRMDFIREARVAGNLNHRNIIRIHDIDQDEGRLFLVMEYLEGAPLSSLISNQTVPVARKLDMIAQICDGLHHAHSHGIIHRDIKPANVFAQSDGTIKVVDFGLSVLRSSSLQGAPLAGTLAYMSPEQIKRLDLDGRTDIWSTGVVLYEFLMGEMPYRSNTTDGLLREILQWSAPPELNHPLLPGRELNRVLRRAMAADRDKRYSTAAEFGSDLRGLAGTLRFGPNSVAENESNWPAMPDSTPRTEGARESVPSRRYATDDLGFCEPGGWAVSYKETTIPRADTRQSWPLGLAVALMLADAVYKTLPLWPNVLLGGLYSGIQVYEVCKEKWKLIPRCLDCRKRMDIASRWSQFVTLKEEVDFGMSDCIGCLRRGMWEESAKLLRAYGSDTPKSYTGVIYRLEFYECKRCRQQRARLLAEELLEGRWARRADIHEASRSVKPSQIASPGLIS